MSHQRLLRKDSCLVLQPSLVKELGRSTALVLQQIHYWLSSNQYGKEHDGRRWIYNSYNAWEDQIKIYSISTIRRSLVKLEELGFISSDFLSTKKSDRTKWYSINYENLNDVKCNNDGEGDVKGDSFIPAAQKKSVIANYSQKNVIKMDIPSVQKEHILIETKTTSKNQKSSEELKGSDIVLKLFEIWKKRVGEGRALCLNPKRSRFLMAAFRTKFKGCFEKWTAYCDAIASSDFLMGRVKTTFKASLDWVLKFDIIQRILEGDFGVKKDILQPSNLSSKSIDYEQKCIQAQDESDEIKNLRMHVLQRVGQGAYRSWFKDATFFINESGAGVIGQGAFWKNYVITHFAYVLNDLRIVCDNSVGW